MKRFLLLILLAAIAALPVSAQKKKKAIKTSVVVSKAPPAVAQAFEQHFTAATDVKWNKMASGNWFASFNQDSLLSKVEYTADGQWVATRTKLTKFTLPDTVVNAIQLKYPGAAINNALRIQRADVPAYYQIALEVNGAEKDILANDAGSITE